MERPKLNTWKTDINGKEIWEGMILKDDNVKWRVEFGKYRADNNLAYNNEFAYGFYIISISPFKEIIDQATNIQYMEIIE